MLRKFFSQLQLSTRRCGMKMELNPIKRGMSSTLYAVRSSMPVDEDLRKIFELRNTKISNWIIEDKARALCARYTENDKENRQRILRTLASRYAVQHDNICQVAKKLLCTESENVRQIVVHERTLRNVLTPAYHWLFVIVGRLQNGVKFLVDLRTDVLELLAEVNDPEESVIIQELNHTLRDLFLLWFSVGFLHMERVTWESACDILQKVSDYEAIHPIKNWLDLKRRVGPYRRCYIFTHPSMPREPIVVLHTALCDIIPDSVKGIEEAEIRILGSVKKDVTFLEEDKSKIKAAIFYSIASTQKGLQGIELGNYLIKKVASEITTEFPAVQLLSSLSPIPNFKSWLLDKLKQDVTFIFSMQEYGTMKSILETKDVALALKRILGTSLWTKDRQLSESLKNPLLRACAWYLYKEKRRGYALNSVANFHLRNGAVMWRINWMADPSPRGTENSCGIMVNYRYFLDKCEENSRNYIEHFVINASEDVINLAAEAEKSRTCKSKL
ncbi:malonyl-CoA decarboxylase, mitochondrial-like [Pseudomyrmex gracilis]|uniref:malonyl-CoA decarboxylase, mitochondrial-like n=1 Tax=Pseudomyrmex gracilis TaxID=219809 RepID=UPI00099596DA|nr:malonyl-CoA decarboxylase, mitochondrial-like [Pseudomyrmex gracilis]XP_020291206.1 malonyl-CoA decarboxylase, mitochondrial-like [Pseudomyrmex gracilis]